MDMKRRTLLLPILILPLILVAGCNQGPSTTPVPAAATVKPAVTPGSAPAPTAMLEPTEPSLPTQIAVAAASATPEPTEDLRAIYHQRPTATPTSTPGPRLPVCLKAPTPLQTGPAPAKPVQVVFTKEGDVWRWREGGETVRLTQLGDVREVISSDDGLVISFVRGSDESAVYNGREEYRTPELWAVNNDGSNVRQLLSADELIALAGDASPGLRADFHELSWVSGQHVLAFDVFPWGLGARPRDAIWLIDADTGERRVLLPPGKAGNFVYTPDGGQIALIGPTAISLVNADGSDLRPNLVTYPGAGLGEHTYRPSVWWSADSRSLRTVVPTTSEYDAVMPFAIWNVPVRGTSPAQLGTVVASGFSVSLSPDLATIAFWRPDSPRSNLRDLYLANADGTGEGVYHADYDLEFLGWAPDSEHFAFWKFGEWIPQLGQLCGGFVPLTDVSTASFRWIDASRFLFVSSPKASRLRPPDLFGPWELRLGTVGGASILIARVEDLLPSYNF
jgi:hypothetical protein